MKEYKYKNYIKQFDPCPSLKDEFEGLAYRFVHSDINHASNWLPNVLIPSYIGKDPSCSSYALSFFKNREKAEKFYIRTAKKYPNFKDRSGDYISFGVLCKCDGTVDKEDNKSHFNLFEFESCSFEGRFIILNQIKVA